MYKWVVKLNGDRRKIQEIVNSELGEEVLDLDNGYYLSCPRFSEFQNQPDSINNYVQEKLQSRDDIVIEATCKLDIQTNEIHSCSWVIGSEIYIDSARLSVEIDILPPMSLYYIEAAKKFAALSFEIEEQSDRSKLPEEIGYVVSAISLSTSFLESSINRYLHVNERDSFRHLQNIYQGKS